MDPTTILLALATLATVSLAQTEQSVNEWHVASMPDPINYPTLCGRNVPSFVCDPENILPRRLADEIDTVLQNIYNTTTVNCYTLQGSKRKGYLVMLAVVPKMKKYFTRNSTDNMKTRFLEGRSFAYHLGRKELWGRHSSNCQEMIIIVYSKEDMVLYTSTQKNARTVVTDDVVRFVLLNTLTNYFPFTISNERAARAIQYMVSQYSDQLQKE